MTEAKRGLAVPCRGLTKTYGTGDTSVMALRGVDLDVHCGELLMLVENLYPGCRSSRDRIELSGV